MDEDLSTKLFFHALEKRAAAKKARAEAGMTAGGVGPGKRDEMAAKFEAAKAEERAAEVDILAVVIHEHRMAAADRVVAEKEATARAVEDRKRAEEDRARADADRMRSIEELASERLWQRRSAHTMTTLTVVLALATIAQAFAAWRDPKPGPAPVVNVAPAQVTISPPTINVLPAPVLSQPFAAPTSIPTPQPQKPGSVR